MRDNNTTSSIHVGLAQHLTKTGRGRGLSHNCWIRGHEFTINLDDIDDVLGFEDLEYDFTHYKDIMLSIETVKSHIGGV